MPPRGTVIRTDDLPPPVGEVLSVDLSKAAELKEMEFECALDPSLVLAALRAFRNDHRNLQKVAVYPYAIPYRQDFLLARLRESLYLKRETEGGRKI